jgi:hypothetical protein
MSKDYLKWYTEPVTKEVPSDYYTAPVKSLRKTKVAVKKVVGLKVIDINEKNKIASAAKDDSSDSGVCLSFYWCVVADMLEEDKAVVIRDDVAITQQRREARMKIQLAAFKDIGMLACQSHTLQSHGVGAPKAVDLSPPRKRGHESPPLDRDEPDISPPRKRLHQDLSPPRKREQPQDLSPPRNRNRDNTDLSPPRNRNRDNTDLSPPRKRSEDLSPPRKREQQDISPPRKRSNDLSPPRKKSQDVSPPRRRNQDNPAPVKKEDDLSPPRKRDESPPRKKTHGLFLGRQFHSVFFFLSFLSFFFFLFSYSLFISLFRCYSFFIFPVSIVLLLIC